jgi:hypothetical protein
MFAVTMMTLDRRPKENYLVTTLTNLARSRVFRSPLLDSFHLCVSRTQDEEFAVQSWAASGIAHTPHFYLGNRGPTANAAFALRQGAKSGAPWVLFLEDDIDVCDYFLESTATWLDEHEHEARVFPLGANYEFIRELFRQGKTAWAYPIDSFYGTLAVALRAADAEAIADYLESPDVNHSYDLHISAWAKQQGIRHFLTPVPSFVQHIGTESYIRPDSPPIVYTTWIGRHWSYAKEYHAQAHPVCR